MLKVASKHPTKKIAIDLPHGKDYSRVIKASLLFYNLDIIYKFWLDPGSADISIYPSTFTHPPYISTPWQESAHLQQKRTWNGRMSSRNGWMPT